LADHSGEGAKRLTDEMAGDDTQLLTAPPASAANFFESIEIVRSFCHLKFSGGASGPAAHRVDGPPAPAVRPPAERPFNDPPN